MKIEMLQKRRAAILENDPAGSVTDGILTQEELALSAEIHAEVGLIDESIKAFERAEATAPLRAATASKEVAVILDEADKYAGLPDGGFAGPADFLLTIVDAARGGKEDVRLKARRSGGVYSAVGSDEQQEGVPGYGGYTVPDVWATGLHTIPNEVDPTVGRVTNVPMASPVVRLNSRVDTSHATSVAGGIVVARRAETAAATDSRMSFSQVTLNATWHGGVTYASDEVLADSAISLVSVIGQSYADAFRGAMLNEKIRGTGTSEPQGVIGAAATISVARETTSEINFADILNMRSRCWGFGNAIWICNHDAYPALRQMVSGGTYPALVYQPSVVEGRPDSLEGRPIFYSEYASSFNAAGDLMLCDWSQYLWGTLGGMNSAESIHVRFVNAERAFRFSMRSDGQPWWAAALTPAESSTTMSPYVILAAGV